MPTFTPPLIGDIPRVLPDSRGPGMLLMRHYRNLSRGRSIVGTGSFGTNLLTADQASVETSTAGWAAVSATCSVSRTAGQSAPDGTWNLLLTATTVSGTMTITSPTGTSGLAVTPLIPYVFSASVKAAVNGRTAIITARWYDAAGVEVIDATASLGSSLTGIWTPISHTAIASATAAFAALQLSFVCPDTEVHFADQFSIATAPAYATVDTPTTDQLVAAGVEGTHWFLGGHEYTITSGVAAALEASGYEVS